ncbi:hypothetical protein G7Y89_g9728 [Cudoniella acicularis]|uniref:Uncharacterized protein n=1 Tax=Cudoniella acicularis TaxID=354080 RepID=A0A8H4RGC5_9HELO|nr:hypothetical protein G7Y89_g9728 [Cudoniella acicularis]
MGMDLGKLERRGCCLDTGSFLAEHSYIASNYHHSFSLPWPALFFYMSSEFPSGSKWGESQLEKLGIALEPEAHPFADLKCALDISPQRLSVLDKLRVYFGVELSLLERQIQIPVGYEDFYHDIKRMPPRKKEPLQTPQKPATRSNTTLPPSSSVAPSSSPWSAFRAKRSAPGSIPSTPVKAPLPERTVQNPEFSEDDLDSTPGRTPKRQRQSSTISPGLPGLPARPATPAKEYDDGVSEAPQLTSSQTDSTYKTESQDLESDSGVSDGDRAETIVTTIIGNLLTRICKEHKDLDGWIFETNYDPDTLLIPICGDFPKTTPDLVLRVQIAGKAYHNLDVEARLP